MALKEFFKHLHYNEEFNYVEGQITLPFFKLEDTKFLINCLKKIGIKGLKGPLEYRSSTYQGFYDIVFREKIESLLKNVKL